MRFYVFSCLFLPILTHFGPIFGIFFTFWAIRGILTINPICAEKMRPNGQKTDIWQKKNNFSPILAYFCPMCPNFWQIFRKFDGNLSMHLSCTLKVSIGENISLFSPFIQKLLTIIDFHVKF